MSSLADTLNKYSLPIPDETAEALNQYCRLLWEWNERVNLTRHLDYERFVVRDVFDSVQLAEHLQPEEEVLDVGSGSGVPGIVLSLLRPDLTVELCESVGKKAKALDDIVSRLQVSIPVHHARAEDLLDDFRFTSLCARAVSSLSKMLTWFQPKWASFDRLVLIKGPKWVEERGEARHLGLMRNLELRKLASYETPSTGAENVILEIRTK